MQICTLNSDSNAKQTSGLIACFEGLQDWRDLSVRVQYLGTVLQDLPVMRQENIAWQILGK